MTGSLISCLFFPPYYITICKFSSMRNKNIQTLRSVTLISSIINIMDKLLHNFLMIFLFLFLTLAQQQ
ncbi:hypothetical protein CUC49_01440 [Citrobacter pasteurii]|nr:hypothetical protein CUC49_01440 [Citrobacter pasteurii]